MEGAASQRALRPRGSRKVGRSLRAPRGSWVQGLSQGRQGGRPRCLCAMNTTVPGGPSVRWGDRLAGGRSGQVLAQAESRPVAERHRQRQHPAGSRTVAREVAGPSPGRAVLQGGDRQGASVTGTSRACRGSQVSGTIRGPAGGHSAPPAPIRLASGEPAREGGEGQGRVSARYHRDRSRGAASFTVESGQGQHARD